MRSDVLNERVEGAQRLQSRLSRFAENPLIRELFGKSVRGTDLDPSFSHVQQ